MLNLRLHMSNLTRNPPIGGARQNATPVSADIQSNSLLSLLVILPSNRDRVLRLYASRTRLCST